MDQALRHLILIGAVAACGARTDVGGVARVDAGAPFPNGTFTACAFGTESDGPFLIPSGFDPNATLTVSGSGDARTATFVDANAKSYAWSFSTTSSVSAQLANEQIVDGFAESICVYGVGVSNEKFFPTKLDVLHGAMTYESGAIFVALEGELTSQTDCGDIGGQAHAWIACTGGPSGAITAPAVSSKFPTGDLACKSQIGTHGKLNGLNAFITSGSSGTLTLAQTGPHVTATYTDKELDAALDFTMNDSATASALPGQSLTATCAPDPASGALSLTAASLMTAGDTVFLSFAGTTSACSGEKIGTLVCAK